MSRFLVIAGALFLLAAAISGAAALPLGRDILLGLGGALVTVAMVMMVRRSRYAARRRSEATRAAQVAAADGLAQGRALALSLQLGQVPAPLTVWGLVMLLGETAYLDVPVFYSRFYGHDVVHRHSSSYYLGGEGAGVAFAAAWVMVGDSVERSRAVRGAQPQWRDHLNTRVIATNLRLLVLAHHEWLEFGYPRVKAFYPDPEAGHVVLEFSGDCSPLRLSGAAAPSVMAYLCWAIHGADGLRTHPALHSLR